MMPKTAAVTATYEAELELLRQDPVIFKYDRLQEELDVITKLLRNRIPGQEFNDILSVFCEANL